MEEYQLDVDMCGCAMNTHFSLLGYLGEAFLGCQEVISDGVMR